MLSWQKQVIRASTSHVGTLIAQTAAVYPERVAVEDADRLLTYRELWEQSGSLAIALRDRGIGLGDRIALLSENRAEVLVVMVAAARLGVIVACQNWRLSVAELRHCIALVEPKLLIHSPRYENEATQIFAGPRLGFAGDPREPSWLPRPDDPGVSEFDAEQAFLILYTSGTTGLPKGAVLSHRAELARNQVLRAEFGIENADTFVAWSPLFHMGAAEPALGTLMCGGKVVVVDGYQPERLAHLVENESLGWLLLMPGMIDRFSDVLEERAITPRGVKVCGVMADLIPPREIARATRLLQAPFANTFGATETGCPPCSSNLLPIGEEPRSLSKQQSPFCEIRLVDANDCDVPLGEPGELCMRGPTLFSGYWNEPEVNASDFRGGWFHMGDVFVRNVDGTLDFVDRVKYLIKSGGENIYPAEIERVLLEHPAVLEAAVVRRKDDQWGEVPVAFVGTQDQGASPEELARLCRDALAGYKVPKSFNFIPLDEFPRSASGKVKRGDLEKRMVGA